MRWSAEQLADYEARHGRDAFPALVASKGANPVEDVDHLAVARYLDLLGVLWQHSPNEGKRSPKTGAKLKQMGMRQGFPDFQIFDAPPLYPCAKGVIIELKRQKGGKVSDDQRYWLAELGRRGWVATVAEGANEALDYLRSLGWILCNDKVSNGD